MCVCVCVRGESERGGGKFLISVTHTCELLDKKKEIKTFVCVIACNASNIMSPLPPQTVQY